MPFVPLDDRVLVKPVKPESKQGSLYVPDKAQAITQYLVVSVGSRAAATLKAGDIVLIASTNTGVGERLVVDGERAFLLRLREIVGLWSSSAE